MPRQKINKQKLLSYYAAAVMVIFTYIDALALARVPYYITIRRVTYPAVITWNTGDYKLDVAVIAVTAAIAAVGIPGKKKLAVLAGAAASLLLAYIVNNPYTAIAAIITAVAAILLLLEAKIASKGKLKAALKVDKQKLNSLISALVNTLIAVETVALAAWTLTIFKVDYTQTLPVFLELQLWHSLDYLTVLLLPLMFYWYIPKLIIHYKKQKGKPTQQLQKLKEQAAETPPKWMLPLALLLSVLIPTIPYLPTLNPEQKPVAVDVIYCIRWLTEMDSDPWKAFQVAGGTRPLYLLPLYFIHTAFNTPIEAVAKYHNIALFPLYTLACYLFTREYFNKKTAAYAALLTPLSPSVLGFIYGGFQANLLALPLMLTSLALMAKPTAKKTATATALAAATLWIHPWTWTHITAGLALYYLAEAYPTIRREGLRKALPKWRLQALFIAATVIIAVTRDLTGYGALHSAGVLASPSKLPSTPLHNFTGTLSLYLWGTITNAPTYTLALLGLIAAKTTPIHTVIAASSIPATLGNTGIITRLAINSTPHLPTAHTLSNWKKRSAKILVAALLAANTLRMLANSIPP